MSKDRACARYVLGHRKYYVFSEWEKDDRAFSIALTDGRTVYRQEGATDWHRLTTDN